MAKPEDTEPHNTQHFYRNLKGFNKFSDIHSRENYSRVPENWFVLITDISQSTEAIKNGKYREINTLGAATISCLQTALGTLHFPFVFGGDGATALIHGNDVETAKSALFKLQNFAKNIYDFDLRLGAIRLSEIYEAGHSIEVAKFFMNPQKSIAMFRGGGLSWCDDQLKNNPAKYCLTHRDDSMSDLPGLSCRWHPLKSERGKILTLLIEPQKGHNDTLIKDVVQNLESILGGDLNRACPVRNSNMKYKSLKEIIDDEWKHNESHTSRDFFSRLVSIFICIWAFRFKLPIFFDSKTYTDQISSHSDYRKFDDRLRMVVDCTIEESIKIEKFLHNKFLGGDLFYGIHSSDFSLMTCLVENLQQGGHIHFIDGGEGGYAVAATHLKTQISRNSQACFKKAN